MSSIPFPFPIPFIDHLGMVLQRFEGGEAELVYTPLPEHLNSFGVAHGGAVMTLLDVTMGSAARSVAPDSGVVTIEMKTSFMRPATGTLTGRGRLLHRTRSIAFAEASVYDEHGELCARASGTFRYKQRPPPPADAAAPRN